MNSQRIIIQPIYDVLEIKSVKVKRKTEELMRLLDLRAAGGLRGGSNCKYTACLHLACKLNGEPFDLDKALRACGVSSQVYTDTYSTVSSILELAPPIPFEELCIKFGCPEIAKSSKRVLEKYKELFVKGLPENRRADVRFDRNVFPIVAFFLTAEYKKKKVDKRKLLEYAGVTYPDFDSIYASMDELIFAPIRAEEAAERAIEAAKKAKKEPKKETESKVDTKVEKEKSNTASELSLDEDKENNDQNNVKGKKKQAKQSAITVNELLEQKSIVNEDLFKKELDDTFDVDVEVEQEAPVTRIERKKRKRDEYEQWREKALQDSREQELPRKTKQSKLHFASTVSSQGEKAKPDAGEVNND
jgi:hypothetical protein